MIIDLTGTEYLDGQALRVLKHICDTADRNGTKLKLVAPPQSIARHVLELAQMQEYVEILDDAPKPDANH